MGGALLRVITTSLPQIRRKTIKKNTQALQPFLNESAGNSLTILWNSLVISKLFEQAAWMNGLAIRILEMENFATTCAFKGQKKERPVVDWV